MKKQELERYSIVGSSNQIGYVRKLYDDHALLCGFSHERPAQEGYEADLRMQGRYNFEMPYEDLTERLKTGEPIQLGHIKVGDPVEVDSYIKYCGFTQFRKDDMIIIGKDKYYWKR